MAKPFKYRDRWRIQVTLKNGQRPFKDFDNYHDAKSWGAQAIAQQDNEHAPLLDGPRSTTLARALDHYARHFSVVKKGLKAELNRINHYLEGAGMTLLKPVQTIGGGYEVQEVLDNKTKKSSKRSLSDYVDKRRGLRAKTYEKIASLAKMNCSQISQADIRALYAQMESDGLSASTIQKEIALLKSLYNSFGEFNWPGVANPCTAIKLGKHTRRFVALNPEQQQSLNKALAACDNPYFWPLVVVAKESTLRLGTLSSMRWEQLDLEGRSAMLDSKTGQEIYKIPSTVLEVLKSLPRQSSGPVFPMSKSAIASMWKRVRIAAGIPKLQFRDLRHLGATEWVRRGLNAHQLKHVLGHSSVQTAQYYVDLVASDMEDALDKASANGGVILLPPPPAADAKAHISAKRAARIKERMRKTAEKTAATNATEAEAIHGAEAPGVTPIQALLVQTVNAEAETQLATEPHTHGSDMQVTTAKDVLGQTPTAAGAVIISMDALRKARKAA